MLIGFAALSILVGVPAFGGRYGALARLKIRGTSLIMIAFAIQIAVISVFEIDSVAVSKGLHILSYLMLGACLARNRHVKWLWVISLGWASNFAAIALNSGVMPTSARAARALDRNLTTTFENSALLTNPRLGFLGDVFISPEWMPLRNVFSVGDVLLLIGLCLTLVTASRTSPPAPALDARRPYSVPPGDRHPSVPFQCAHIQSQDDVIERHASERD